ncbi:hypothetical protein SLEP1_g16885 [Rubroshorea leprosula]|uniref:Uncharacterized protein n=1 Tax=Rubroshorea leprosula TaxID=152421 RepID=A0AAV5IZX4_9ROSI|nr:hypothetical protein SLEP1_g16885 [Rubroshorea leprosula]
MNLSRVLKKCLLIDSENGAPLATMFARVALFAATLLLRKTRLYSKYDGDGIKTAMLFHTCAFMLCNSKRWSRLRFIRWSCGVKVNLTANIICLILGILFEKFYEMSLGSLCFGLSMAIMFLILLVIIRPRTDLGFSGFLIGAIGSVAYNLFQLKFGTWIVVAICFVLLGFKCWLDNNWLELEVDQWLPTTGMERSNRGLSKSFPKSLIQRIDAVSVAGFYLVWAYNLFSTNCLAHTRMKKLACGTIYGLWVSTAQNSLYFLLWAGIRAFWLGNREVSTAIISKLLYYVLVANYRNRIVENQ